MDSWFEAGINEIKKETKSEKREPKEPNLQKLPFPSLTSDELTRSREAFQNQFENSQTISSKTIDKIFKN